MEGAVSAVVGHFDVGDADMANARTKSPSNILALIVGTGVLLSSSHVVVSVEVVHAT
jgi:hypothetical protein